MYRPKLSFLFWFAIFSSNCILSSYAQNKVALVLSGGGAKGAAHLGVIKALEEHNIPIDYIIGTSMGGVVGAFYAAGYSIPEIEALIESGEVEKWVTGVLESKYRYFVYKKEDNPSALTLKIGLDSLFKTSLKSTLVNDNSINFALAEWLSKASAKANCNFDSLFVPFRCLASDIFTQEVIMLKDGSLPDAVRATLSVPLFFKPIRIKGKYLFDGGIYDNFPVLDAVKEFNPDVIIGVNVSSKTFKEYPYERDDEYIDQALFYMLLSKSDSTQINKKGVYIEPDLEQFSALDFSKLKEIYQSGYESALKKIDTIEAKIERRVSRESLDAKRIAFKRQLPDYKMGQVNIVGLQSQPKSYVKNMFYYRGDKLTFEEIKKKFFRLAEADKFEVLYPNFTFNDQNKVYDFNLLVKPYRDFKIDVGGNIGTRNVSNLFLGFDYSILSNFFYNFRGNFYVGRFYTSTDLRIRISIPTKVPIFIEPQFLYNEWNYLSNSELFYNFNDDKIILLQNDSRFSLNIGVAAGRLYRFDFSASYFNQNDQYSNTNTIATTGVLDQTKFEGQTYSISYSYNTLNRKLYANSGSSLLLMGRYVDGFEIHIPGSTSIYTDNYTKFHQWFYLKANMERYIPLGRFSLGFMAEAVFSTQDYFRNYTSSIILSPAFLPLADSRTLFFKNFRNPAYAAIGIRNVVKIAKSIDFRLEGYLFNAFEPLNEVEQQAPYRVRGSIDIARLIGNAVLVWHSRLGPLSLQASYYDSSKQTTSYFINFGYLIFNKKALE